jgi:serine/threonine-protein kinase
VELRQCVACRALRPSGTLCAGCGGPLTLADERLLLGEVFGKYRLESVLGAGGMGVVYRVTHSTLGRPAALKIVLPRAGGEGFERRFLREARVLAELKHPAIVEIYDFDVSPWGPPYYVMECLEGATLRGVIAAAGGPLAP